MVVNNNLHMHGMGNSYLWTMVQECAKHYIVEILLEKTFTKTSRLLYPVNTGEIICIIIKFSPTSGAGEIDEMFLLYSTYIIYHSTFALLQSLWIDAYPLSQSETY